MKTINCCDICEISYGIRIIKICPKCNQKTKQLIVDELKGEKEC